MGKSASKLRSVVRPVKNFNVEDRAFKQISKEKTGAAPPHPSMEKIMEEIRNDPELLNRGKLSEDERNKLSQVYLKSQGDNWVIRTKQNLPSARVTPVDNVYGVEEPAIIPKGRITLRQTLELMEKYQQDKEKNTPEVLAKEYNLEIPVTINVLTKFRPFQVYVQPKPEEKAGVEKLKQIMAKPFVFDKPRIPSK